MNSQSQNPSGGSTGGRSSAGDPPSPPDETRGGSHSAHPANRTEPAAARRARSARAAASPAAAPLSGSPDADIPVITPTFGAPRPIKSGNATGSPYPAAEPGGAQSFGSSGWSESRAGDRAGATIQPIPPDRRSPRQPAPKRWSRRRGHARQGFRQRPCGHQRRPRRHRADRRRRQGGTERNRQRRSRTGIRPDLEHHG